MSTGVSNNDGQPSCNVQLSSGTSMATPMVASTALIVKGYLEDPKFWGQICNATYRSCPNIVPSLPVAADAPSSSTQPHQHVSSTLLKAILVHSATDMKQILGNFMTQIPTTNLTAPPDRFQGWGQVILQNVLPLPDLYNYDLYLAQQESLPSLTRRTYSVVVTHRHAPLCATIVWNDPPNVLWAAKNLLNDLDLMIVSPTGKVYYGNNRQGDEFNAVEKVFIPHPALGEYKVYVTSKQFPRLSSSPSSSSSESTTPVQQPYSIVITSMGYVNEQATSTQPIASQDIIADITTTLCQQRSPNHHLVRFQLEDWRAGLSWSNIYFTISEWNDKLSQKAETIFIKTFLSNHDRRDAVTNRIEQFSVCLESSKKYFSELQIIPDDGGGGEVGETVKGQKEGEGDDVTKENMKFIRVSSPQCQLQLSKYWQNSFIELNKMGRCNVCERSQKRKTLELIMLANVTDDDFVDYSW
jgi:hypothetical protein